MMWRRVCAAFLISSPKLVGMRRTVRCSRDVPPAETRVRYGRARQIWHEEQSALRKTAPRRVVHLASHTEQHRQVGTVSAEGGCSNNDVSATLSKVKAAGRNPGE